MFILADWEVPQTTLDVLQDEAHVEPDGFMWFPGERPHTSQLFNSCQLYLQWEVGESFGVQLIKLGSKKLYGRGGWRAQLLKRHHVDTKTWKPRIEVLIEERAEKIRAAFPDELVIFHFLGWTILNTKYWTPTKFSRVLDTTSEKYATRVRPLTDEEKNTFSDVEKSPHD